MRWSGPEWQLVGSAAELVSQLVKLHGAEDLLRHLPGSISAVLLNHQLHRPAPAHVLQLADSDGVRLQLQMILKQPEILGAQRLQHLQQGQGRVH